MRKVIFGALQLVISAGIYIPPQALPSEQPPSTSMPATTLLALHGRLGKIEDTADCVVTLTLHVLKERA